MHSDRLSRRTLLIGAGATAAAAHAASRAPSTAEPSDWTLNQAADALRARKISSTELTQLCLERIHALDHQLNAFITLDEERALTQARECDRTKNETGGRLFGIPIALKDNIDTAGLRTTAASNVFRNRIPAADAEVTRRLKAASVVCLGKLNLDEMAFEGTGTTSCFGPVCNPWKTEHITGGSSAGSAAAVSSGFCFGSVGSDDGGSVRIPGAFCGVVGFKTSYGRVSTRGVIPSAYSTDTIGPITRTVEDAATLLQVLAGFDQQDSITVPYPVPDYTRALSLPISELRIGIPREYFFDQLHPDVSAAVESAIELIQTKVKSVRDVSLPRMELAPNGTYDVELYHYQKQFFDKTPELYHPWSQRQLNELKSVQTVPYIETLKRIRDCRRDIRRTFEEVDILLLPTKREPAPLITETVNETHHRPPSNTVAFNHFGTPAMTVPCGFSRDGPPIGLQIVGAPFAEPLVIAIASAYEQSTDWHRRRPTILKS